MDFSSISTCARTRPASTSKACNTWAALAIGEIVEASSECLAVDRDDAARRIGKGAAQTSGVLAENLLDRLGFKALEDISNRAYGLGYAASADRKAAFNLAAVHFDEGHDGAVGIAAGDDSKDREQQDMLQLVELTPRPGAGRGYC